MSYDAILVVSFGGPEGMDDVLPFLENVLRGRNVPHARMIEVSHHYELFDGVSPINEQNRALISALRTELDEHNIDLPIYFGNRNWHPLLPDTMQQMSDDGVKNVLAFFTSMFSCYSGCRQYRENLFDAQQIVGENAPQIDKIRKGYNHPLFIEANVSRLREAFAKIPSKRWATTQITFTAHSIPLGQAENSRYVEQLTESCRLTAEALNHRNWQLVYQSRSGAPHIPWLEPDICDYLDELKEQKVEDVIVAPIGFISDHMEVIFDLDTEAREKADELGINMVRAGAIGTHPAFVAMIRELIQERMEPTRRRRAIGIYGPNHDVCPSNCCQSGRPGPSKPAAAQVGGPFATIGR